MKKRVKLLIGLLAAVLALALTASGLSRWSTDINLRGDLTAEGAWNVAITGGQINRVSTGALVNGQSAPAAKTATVWVCDVVADYYNNAGYRYNIDDTSARQVEIARAELDQYSCETYDVSSFTVPASSGNYSYYVSGGDCSAVDYKFRLNQLGLDLGFGESVGTYRAASDGGVYDGLVMGTAIAVQAYGKTLLPGIVMTYNDAVEALKDETTGTAQSYTATIGENGHTATYPDVTLTLPGAWAEYSLTVANNGTTSANLGLYKVEVTGVEGVISVAAPSLPADEVLEPGERCTLSFVVYIDRAYQENLLQQSGQLSVRLLYEQDAIEEMPLPTHDH